MLSSQGLSPLHLLALYAALSEDEGKKIQDQVAAGAHDVDVVLRLKGSLRVGVASFANQPNKIDQWTLIAVLADRLRPETFKQIVEELCERMNNKQPLFDADKLESLKTNTQELMKRLLGTTRQERRGQVQFEGLATPARVGVAGGANETIELHPAKKKKA